MKDVNDNQGRDPVKQAQDLDLFVKVCIWLLALMLVFTVPAMYFKV